MKRLLKIFIIIIYSLTPLLAQAKSKTVTLKLTQGQARDLHELLADINLNTQEIDSFLDIYNPLEQQLTKENQQHHSSSQRPANQRQPKPSQPRHHSRRYHHPRSPRRHTQHQYHQQHPRPDHKHRSKPAKQRHHSSRKKSRNRGF